MRAITATFAAALLATAVVAAGPSAAQSSTSVVDQAFVVSVLQEATGQMAFARYAEPRAHSDAVQRLATTTYETWHALAGRLDAIAANLNLPTPSALTPPQQRMLDELAASASDDFDAAYVRIAETDYTRALAAFRSASRSDEPSIAATVAAERSTFEQLDRRTTSDPALPGTF